MSKRSLAFCTLILLAVPGFATDQIWKTVQADGKTYEIHVVSDGGVGGGFPDRALSRAADSGLVSDIYVMDTSTGQALEIPRARILLGVVQSSFKVPARPGSGLFATDALLDADVTRVTGAPYELYTSFYFRPSWVDDFIRNGLGAVLSGLDDFERRADLYADLLVDMALQPELDDNPRLETRYQTVLDGAVAVEEFAGALEGQLDEFIEGTTQQPIDWTTWKTALDSLVERNRHYFDLNAPEPEVPAPLERLKLALGGVQDVAWVTGAYARAQILEALAQERGLLRMEILASFVSRAEAAGGVDPALVEGAVRAGASIDAYVSGYYDNLANVLIQAALEDPDAVLRLGKYSKYLVQRWLSQATLRTIGRVAYPYLLSYEVYNRIREQEDRARLASLAATLQRELFEPFGLAHHRDRMLSGGNLNGKEAQAFLELYQMSWYLAARHYEETYNTLGNQFTRWYGRAIDLFTGFSYTQQLAELQRFRLSRRTTTQRLVPPGYLATVPQPFERRAQDAELAWLYQFLRDDVVGTPTGHASESLDICVTLPFDPSGTPADRERMNIRFEPRPCSSTIGSWECSPGDSDGECTARVQLFWDDDRNPDNADCNAGSGPCAIPGAEDLHPRRSPFVWEALKDGVARGDYYILATITDGAQSVARYSDGFYSFIDPIFEPDAWDVVAVEASEGADSDDDGIPEIGEELRVVLTLKNSSGRSLDGIEVKRLRLEGEAVRQLTEEDWTKAENGDLSFILDGSALVPDAGDGGIVTASDDLELWVGRGSSTEIGLVAWVEYWDRDRSDDPDIRRIQEIGFTVHVSDGTDAPSFRCDHTDVVSDTDGDGTFESGEIGGFTATLCNDGTWEGQQIRGVFDDPPSVGRWVDEDSAYRDLNPTECQPSEDVFKLRTERDECGSIDPTMTVLYNGGLTQAGVRCELNVACVPYQGIQDEVEAGTVATGDPITASIRITNTGSAPLLLTGVIETSGATDSAVTSFPSSLGVGESGFVEVQIDTTNLPPGRDQRAFRIDSNANNGPGDERVSTVFFGVSDTGEARQITFNGVGNDPADVSGRRAVFQRGFDIYVVDLFTSAETRLTETGSREYKARIHGDRVAFVRDEGDPSVANVVLYELSTGQETALTDLAARQSEPDVFGDTVVWEDERAGKTTADIYRYRIGESPVNGELRVELGTNRAATDPRLGESHLAYIIRAYSDPFTFQREMGYLDRATGQQSVKNPACRVGSQIDVFGPHLAMQCDCRDACDGDDQIYYVDMSTGSGPARLTCDAALGNDREEPLVLGDEIFYKLDQADDLYKVAIGSGCQTEIPLHDGVTASQKPAGDPNTGAYVFHDNRTGRFELWGVIPPPPIQVAVTSFDLEAPEIFQEDAYPFAVEVRNLGTEDVTSLPVSVRVDGGSIFSETVPTLAAGGSSLLEGTWSTVGVAAGAYTLEAALDPPPSGDGEAMDNARSLQRTVLDDDTLPPVISALTVLPSGGDGDQFIEDGEALEVRWEAQDPKGISATSVTIAGVEHAGFEQADGSYLATVSSPGVGDFEALVNAADDDDSPASTQTPTGITFSVFPASPTIIARIPSNGTTDVDRGTVVEAAFSGDLDPGSVNSQSFLLFDPVGVAIEAVVSYKELSRTARLEPSSFLDPDAEYMAHLPSGPSGVRDIRGNPLAADEVWTFTTEAPSEFTLTVSLAGAGTVTSDPVGIDCGSDCIEVYPTGTVVTLTPTPEGDIEFIGWLGDPDCADSAVTMDADKSCVAQFGTTIFSDGFESGDTSSWTEVVP